MPQNQSRLNSRCEDVFFKLTHYRKGWGIPIVNPSGFDFDIRPAIEPFSTDFHRKKSIPCDEHP
jgi:hypothetical protein